jgi:hypothetical protein
MCSETPLMLGWLTRHMHRPLFDFSITVRSVDSTGERNALRRMEECSHEAETSDLLFGQSEGTWGRNY